MVASFQKWMVLVVGLLLLGAPRSEAQWSSVGTLNVPPFNYTFLATTPAGDLLAGTYNRADTARELPAILIRNPTSPNPEVQELCRVPFPVGRGFGGIACDGEGNFFVTGDTGDREGSFVRKFQPNGQPATEFGNGGMIKPNRRCLGVEALGTYVLVAVDWGEMLVLDGRSGRQVGAVPKAPEGLYLRDIAMDPRSLRIFGVAQGGIVTWGGGAPWSAASYQYRRITEGRLPAMMGEGIALDPFLRCVVIAPPNSGEVREVYGDGRVVRSKIESVQDRSSLTDCAISHDGTTLFVSDYTNRLIHVLRRAAPGGSSAAVANVGYAATNGAGSGNVPAVDWKRSYTDALPASRAAGKPMLVYFRSPRVNPCLEFEKNVLLGREFSSRAQGFTSVFEDVTANRLLAYQFGIVRVPHVVAFSRSGEQVGELAHPIDLAKLGQLMEAAAAAP